MHNATTFIESVLEDLTVCLKPGANIIELNMTLHIVRCSIYTTYNKVKRTVTPMKSVLWRFHRITHPMSSLSYVKFSSGTSPQSMPLSMTHPVTFRTSSRVILCLMAFVSFRANARLHRPSYAREPVKEWIEFVDSSLSLYMSLNCLGVCNESTVAWTCQHTANFNLTSPVSVIPSWSEATADTRIDRALFKTLSSWLWVQLIFLLCVHQFSSYHP